MKFWSSRIFQSGFESVGFQTRDLLEAMMSDWQTGAKGGSTDGGMSASNWAMQFLSNILNAPVDRPEVLETTAMGTAWLAGRVGLYPNKVSLQNLGHSISDFSLEWMMSYGTAIQDWKSAVAATFEVRT